jgi:hypothetical protein
VDDAAIFVTPFNENIQKLSNILNWFGEGDRPLHKLPKDLHGPDLVHAYKPRLTVF